MNKGFKRLIALVSLLFSLGTVFSFAQVSVDPDHQFYTVAQGWEIRGVVDKIPSLRPYPVSVIRDLISQAMEKGNEKDKKTAEYYAREIFGKSWHAAVEVEANTKLVKGEDSSGFQFALNPSLQGDLCLKDDFVTTGYSLGWYNTTADSNDFIPMYTNFLHDIIIDPAVIGPFNSYVDGNVCTAIGTKNFYLQTGIYRTGWGPNLRDGLALNDTAFHSANVSLRFARDRFAYTQQLSAIGAKSLSGLVVPNKVLAFHAIDFYLLKNFTLSYYEATVYGQRFDLSYLFPAPYMITQGIGGCNDNIWMGLAFEFKPFNGFAWTTDFFVDDLSVNNLVKLNFDGNNRLAFKTGILYTPENSPCSRMTFNYTAITPYTYSHYDKDYNGNITRDTPNYQNYTNNGISMGTSIPPNSDCIIFAVDLTPINSLDIKIESRFIRHANICETLNAEDGMLFLMNDGLCSDGSVLTNSYGITDFLSNANTELNFLNQAHKMYVIDGSIVASYSLPEFKFGQLGFKIGYTFEYINKKGVDSEMFPSGHVTALKDSDGNITGYTVTLDGIVSDPYTPDQIQDVVNIFKNRWAANFHDVVNNYLSVGVVYKY